LLGGIFYPGHPIPQSDLNRSLVALERELETLETSEEFTLLPTRPEWYTTDRFHLGLKGSKQAMSVWIDSLVQSRFGAETRGGPAPTLSSIPFYFRRPVEYSFLGWHRKSKTSARTLSPSATVTYY
jgi:hypothetical protein